jgi:hypothetical protein
VTQNERPVRMGDWNYQYLDCTYITCQFVSLTIFRPNRTSRLDLSTLMAHGMMAPNKMIPCNFFAQGSCRHGGSCTFIHEEIIRSPQVPSDSRANVPCKFLSRPGGCQNGSCPYLHAVDDSKVDMSSNQEFEVNEKKVNNSSFHSS